MAAQFTDINDNNVDLIYSGFNMKKLITHCRITCLPALLIFQTVLTAYAKIVWQTHRRKKNENKQKKKK